MGICTVPSTYPGISPVKTGILKRRKYLTMGRFICDDNVVTHNNSIANLTRGVGERVLFTDRNLTPCAAPTSQGIFDLRCGVYAQALVRDIGRQSPVSRQQFVDFYKGRRRTIYQRACDGLVLKPVRPQDSHMSTFIKAEKINLSAKPDPAPRVIQPRNPRYNVELGKYLLPLEHKMYDAIDRLFKTPTIMSKYNSFDQAKILRDHWESFLDPVCVGLDASRFDQHVSVQALQFEHNIYTKIFGGDKFLRMLLKWQLKNVGFARATDGYFKYVRPGSRMSGDMNTSLGNKLLMCLMSKSFIDSLGVRVGFVNNGDDCLMFLERKHLSRLATLKSWFAGFGFKIVTETPVYEFEHIEFCQCKPLYCNGFWRMVRNVKLCLLKDSTAVSLGHDIKQYRSWLSDVAMCGLSFCADAPVMGSFYRMLQRFGDPSCGYNGQDAIYNGYRVLSRNASCNATSPDVAGRVSFYIQTGIHPDAQLALEHYFDGSVWGGDKRQFITNLHTILKW